MLNDRGVKNHKLSEDFSPSFYDLATCVRHPKNAHGLSKIDFLRVHQLENSSFLNPSRCGEACGTDGGRRQTPHIHRQKFEGLLIMIQLQRVA